MQDAFEYLFKCKEHGVFSSGKIFFIQKLDQNVMSRCLNQRCKEVCRYAGFQPRNSGLYKGFLKMTAVLVGAE